MSSKPTKVEWAIIIAAFCWFIIPAIWGIAKWLLN